MFRFETASEWCELVFHVLAHVRSTSHLPASVYDEIYVEYVEAHAGPASQRTLEEDARLLGAAFPDHVSLARAQLVAHLFDSADTATAHATVDLAELPNAPASVRAALSPIAAGVELLRCAALLEEPTLAMLDKPTLEMDALTEALHQVVAASPTLPRYTLRPVRSLRLRGRLIGDEIWCGLPSEPLQLSTRHVAWQAAHEATVGEVSKAARSRAESVGERDIEHLAVALMKHRAESVGLRAAHQQWLSHLADLPDADPATMVGPVGALFARLTSSDGDASS